MALEDKAARRADERLRLQAARWFAKMRGPDAKRREAAFNTWRSADPRRQAAYDRLVEHWEKSAVLSSTRQASRPTMPRDVEPGAWRWRRLRWGTIALACGALVFALILLPLCAASVGDWGAPFAWPHRITTKIGEIRSVRLSDGTAVTLDADTAVARKFSTIERRISLLRGRARFDVAGDSKRPFIVAAGGGLVVAHGTLFDVELLPDQQVAVTLIRGLVEVEPPLGTMAQRASNHGTRLLPGEHLAFGPAGSELKIEPASPARSRWPSGMLDFGRTPLSQAVAEANRYSQRPIRLADPTLASLQVSGVFRTTDPQGLAASLAAAFDLRVENAANGDLVLARP